MIYQMLIDELQNLHIPKDSKDSGPLSNLRLRAAKQLVPNHTSQHSSLNSHFLYIQTPYVCIFNLWDLLETYLKECHKILYNQLPDSTRSLYVECIWKETS